jgi:cell wall-associated NlpC family hydrolase
MPGRNEFVEIVRSWIGVPWRNVGTRREGVNCLGLLVGAAREMGGLEDLVYKAEPYANFSRPHGEMLRKMKEHLGVIGMGEALPGDLALFRIGAEPQHVVLLTDPGMVVHSWKRAGRVREQPIMSDWSLSSVFRIEELD